MAIYDPETGAWTVLGHISESFDSHIEDIIDYAAIVAAMDGQEPTAAPVQVTLLYLEEPYGYQVPEEDSWIVTYADGGITRNSETEEDMLKYEYHHTLRNDCPWQPGQWVLITSGDVIELMLKG